MLGVEDAGGFGFGDWLRLVTRAQKSGDLWRVLDQMVDVIVHVQLCQNIAGEEFALGLNLLAATHFSDLFGWNLDGFDQLREANALCLGQNLVADLVFKARISVNDVPACHNIFLFPKTLCRVCA